MEIRGLNMRGMKMVPKRSEAGFTLIEILISLGLAGVIMAAVYSTYYSQQKSYLVQEQVAAMQQNLRAAMFHLAKEVRMAGYDPVGGSGAKIVTANPNSIRITMDITDDAGTSPSGDGDTEDQNEDITYSLYTADGIQKLGRKSPAGTNQPVAENIDALNFAYLDENGVETSTLADIRRVQITLVARTGRVDPGYSDPDTYANQQGDLIYEPLGDALKYRRKILSTEVRCRNLGLR